MEQDIITLDDLPEATAQALCQALRTQSQIMLKHLGEYERDQVNIFDLCKLFIWHKTPEGFEYWNKVYNDHRRIKLRLSDIC